jgi:bifunctional UDP-N-acetylglucosamine pyrophosphorylase/glucosamine-1-phosphate N-acetyltransferase
MKTTDIVILAAGKGTRMKSLLPKVLHKLAGKPMLGHVLDAANAVGDSKKIIVTGHGAEAVRAIYTDPSISMVEQAEQLGTGHAVHMALPELRANSKVVILYGDVPLITPDTISKMLDAVDDKSIGLLTIQLNDPQGYGRIIRDADGQIEAIVEQKDASPAQLQIDEVNTGVMSLTSEQLAEWLPLIDNNNAQGEYYLTDLISIARQAGYSINGIQPGSVAEVEGINNRQQLAALERTYQAQLAEALMVSGTSLADPARFDQRGTLQAGTDNFFDVNCIFEGDVKIGSGVSIGSNCHIINSTIGDGVEIKANTVIDQSIIGDRAVLGPFARIRPGTELGSDTKVGNFVETKKAIVGNGSKINHLSYVGDAQLGEKVNVGAGTITCNYDGVNKYKTEIGDNSFIGSNSTLVAPLTVGNEGFVAAGSTVTVEVPAESLAVGRTKQRNIQGWKRPQKNKTD